jgi:hypothetical protein
MFCGYCGKENAKDYSFCSGCGKPLENGAPNQPLQPEDKPENLNTPPQYTQENKIRENSVPHSKYLSVTWWKKGPWPWQARSLDGQTLLGSYETEVKAADVVAKFHGINRMDLMMAAVDSEKEEELRHKLIKKTIDEQWKNRVTKNPEMPKPEGTANDHASSPAQSRIKEHIEPPAVRESVETNTLHADSKTKQTESSNSTSTVILWIVVIAFFGTVMLSTSEGKQRLWNGVEGAIFGTIGMGLFWLLGAIINSITGKEIRTSTLYLVAAGAGFAGRHALIAMLAGQP